MRKYRAARRFGRNLKKGELDANQAAQYLGVSRMCLWRWRADGRGPLYHLAPLGLKLRALYWLADLEEFDRNEYACTGGGPVWKPGGHRGERHLTSAPDFDDPID